MISLRNKPYPAPRAFSPGGESQGRQNPKGGESQGENPIGKGQGYSSDPSGVTDAVLIPR